MKNLASCFFSEFGSRAAKWLQNDRRALLYIPFSLSVLGVFSIVIAHIAAVNGATLKFTATDPNSKIVGEYIHTFGYLSEGNFGLWMTIGLPLFAFVCLLYGRTCGRILAESHLKECKFAGAALFARSVIRSTANRVFLTATFAGLCGSQIATQLIAVEKAKALGRLTEATPGEWDFGTYQISSLNGIKEAFKKWDQTKRWKFLETERKDYLTKLAVDYCANSSDEKVRMLKTNPDEMIKHVLAEKLTLDLQVIAAKGRHPEPDSWFLTFLVFSQTLNAIGYWLSIWLLQRLVIWWCIVRRFLPNPRNEAAKRWVIKWDATDGWLGLKNLWEPYDKLLWAAYIGASYIALQKASPSYWTAVGIGGGGTQTTLICNTLLIIAAAIVAPLSQWYLTYSRLSKSLEAEIAKQKEIRETERGLDSLQDSPEYETKSESILAKLKKQRLHPPIDGWKATLKTFFALIIGGATGIALIPHEVRFGLDTVTAWKYELPKPRD